MAQARFAQTRKSTFYGEYIYDQVVPQDHFFRKMNELLDWPKYSQKMMRWYKGGGEYGRPPFDPVVLLKMLLVAYLYDLSERQTESYINDSMSAKYFLGLGMDQAAPDHSTLTKFKERILQRQRMLKLEQLLADIVQTALEKGIKFGSIQELLGLTEKEKSQILSINLANHPRRKYKEVWIGLGGVQSAVYATEVSLEEYYTYTTEETEKLELVRLTEQLDGNIEQAIKQLVASKRKASFNNI